MASKMAAARQVGQEQEVPAQLLGAVSDLELALDAEHVVAVVAEIEVGGREHAPAMSIARLGGDGSSIIPMKSLSAFMYALRGCCRPP